MVINTSPDVTSFDFEAQADIAQQVPKMIVTDISTYNESPDGASAIEGILVTVIDPSNLALPTQTIFPGDTSVEFNLPYFSGKVKFGLYKVYATLTDADGNVYEWVGDDGETFKSIELCQPNALQNATKNYGGLLLNVDPNCDYGVMFVQDGGTGFVYNGVSPSETETELTVTYPIDPTGTTAQAEATFLPFSFPLTLAGVYSIQGLVTQTYQLTETTSVKAGYYYQNTFDVNCGYTLCKALCDYERLVAEVKSCSIKNPNEALAQLKTLILVIAYLGKIAWFKNCGKKFGNVLEELRKIGGFECNCDCTPQGITPAPFFFGAGTIVAGNVCGDIDLTLTQFQGNIQLNVSDISYSVTVASASSDFVSIETIEGECSKEYRITIDPVGLAGEFTLSDLEGVNLGSPAPSDGDILFFNGTEWVNYPGFDWVDFAPRPGYTVVGRLQYAKDIWGTVYVRGAVHGNILAAGSVPIVLPAGFTPSVGGGNFEYLPVQWVAGPTSMYCFMDNIGNVYCGTPTNQLDVDIYFNFSFNVNA